MNKGDKRQRRVTLVTVVIALIGVALFAYSPVRFLLSDMEQTYVIQNYDSSLSELKEEEVREEWERSREYNLSLATSVLYDPFANGKDEMNEEYQNILNIGGEGVMGHVEIPRIGVDIPIFHGVALATLEKGVGHMEGSSLPVGGVGTHAVLTGHTGLNTSRLFTDLDKLKVGDTFYLHVLDAVLAYEVVSASVVEPHDVASLAPVDGEDLVTLITCTPYGVNSHRLLVQGQRVDFDPEGTNSVGPFVPREYYVLGAFVALVVVVSIVLFVRWRRQQRAV